LAKTTLTQDLKRVRRKVTQTKKRVNRRVTRVKARRAKMHPVRRKQETTGVVLGVVTIACVILGGPILIIASCVTGVASTFCVIASKATPPDAHHVVKKTASHKTRPTVKDDARIHHGVIRTNAFGRVLGQKKKACGAACQFSTKPAETCDCSCGGRLHGSRATFTEKPAPKKRAPARKKPAARKPPVRKRPTVRKPAAPRKPRS
jgi:hypothetical protein